MSPWRRIERGLNENSCRWTSEQLPGPDRAENLHEAIRCYELAIDVRTRERYPVEWAQTVRNKGNAYRELSGPDRAARLREAIRCCDEVLVSYQCHMNCDEWRQKVNKDRKEKVNLATPI
jgi:hypothetical protein